VVIIGSRCGGFDFYARKSGHSELIWLGPTEKSDFDAFVSHDTKIENTDLRSDFYPREMFKLPNLWFGVEFPHKKDGKLHIPENLVYLSWAITKRMGFGFQDIWKSINHPFDIYDRDKNFVTTIKYKPIPVRIGMGKVA
jgi:hypothetical protein